MRNFFSPEVVAVFGSASPGKVGHQIITSMVAGKFAGTLCSINRKAQQVAGCSGHATLVDFPTPVDLAIIAVPQAFVAEALEQCAQQGITSVLIISAGFSEIGNDAEEAKIKRIAKQSGLRIIGPNCAGIMSMQDCFYPCLELHPQPGNIAFLSQSGAVAGAFLGMAQTKGIGFSKFVSLGNKIDISEVEILEYLAQDPHTDVITMYIEGLQNGREFMPAAKRVSKIKPVIVIKSGRTSVGKRAVHSHTGSMAGEDRIYAAAFEQAGLVRVHTVDEMLDLAQGFVACPPMKGNKVAVVTNSGGPGVLAADRCEELSLAVTEPDAQTAGVLNSSLPEIASKKNPFDLTLGREYQDYCLTISNVLMVYDAVIAINVATPSVDSEQIARGIIDGCREHAKPVLTSFMPDGLVGSARRMLAENHICHFATWERCAEVLHWMVQYHQMQAQENPWIGAHVASVPGNSQRAMLEPEAMSLLRDDGLPVPAFKVAQSAEQAACLATGMGFPVVLKVVSTQILHKSDVGGVRLDIRTPAETAQAFTDIQKSSVDKDFQGVIIYPQLAKGIEVMVGIVVDPAFGPVITFGLGGIFAEIIADLSCRVAPIDMQEAGHMIDEIRSSKILKGSRGFAPRDLDSLKSLITRVSRLAIEHPEIRELDLNPVFAYEDGVVIVDAMMIVDGDCR